MDIRKWIITAKFSYDDTWEKRNIIIKKLELLCLELGLDIEEDTDD